MQNSPVLPILDPRLSRRVAAMRFLVVGTGSAGRRHIENLARVGARDIQILSEFRRIDAPSEGPRPSAVHHDFAAALAARPDAVLIANPTSLHARHAAGALAAGAHVYVEKPVAADAVGARAVRDAASASGKTVAVGNQLRFDPCLEALRGWVAAGRLGRIVAAQAMMGEFLPDYHPGEDHRSGYAARRDLGGGVLLTQIHDVNYLAWLIGPFRQAFAVGGRRTDLTLDVEDCVSCLLRTASGVGASLHQDFLQRNMTRRLVLAGDEATATWDSGAGRLSLTSARGTEEGGPDRPPERNALFLACLADFLACASDGGVPRTSAEDALSDVLVVDAVRKSLETEAAVGIPQS